MADHKKKDKEEVNNFMQNLIKCKSSPVQFARSFLDYEPYDYNQPYLNCMDKWIAYRAGRKVGKTMSTAAKCLHYAWYAPLLSKHVKDRCEILIVAPTQNQANIMFDMIKTLKNRSPILKQYVIKEKSDELWLGFINGGGISKIYTRAAGERGDSIRGYVPHVIVADECAFIKRKVLTALIPAGIATDARVWLTSTPFGKSGYFYEACMNARAGMEELKKLGMHKPDGRWVQFHVPSMRNPVVANNPDALEELKMLTKDEYRLEVLGEFAEVGNALIPRHLISKAIGEYRLPNNVTYYLGVDVARSGKDETVFTVTAIDEDQNVYVVHWEAHESTTTIDVIRIILEIQKKFPQIEIIYIDETGLGAGSVDLALEHRLPVRGVTFTLKEKELMYTALVGLFEQGKIFLGDGGIDYKLPYQLSYMTKEYTLNNRMRIVSEEHDDWPDSLALACSPIQKGGRWDVVMDGDTGEPFNIDDLYD